MALQTVLDESTGAISGPTLYRRRQQLGLSDCTFWFGRLVFFDYRGQVLAGVGMGLPGYILRCAGGDDLPASVTAFRAKIDNPVRGFDHVQVMFDDYHRIAVVPQSVQDSE